MNKNKLISAVFIILTALGACKPVSFLTVDLTYPPKEGLPAEIQSLTLVNRVVDKRFTDDPRDSIQLRFYQSQFNLDTVIYDINAADTLLKALGNLLYESGRFDVVIPENRFLAKDTLNPYSEQMSWEVAEDLTKRFNTDAVLSLDYYKTSISAVFGTKKDVRWDNLAEYTYYAANMRISYIANFRLYYPRNKDLLISYFLGDTLVWEGGNIVLKTLFRELTKVKDALTETGIATALDLSKRIAPNWKSYSRVYFSKGNDVLRQTSLLIQKNDWETAMNMWLDKLENTKSKSLRSKFEFNLALAYEMQGELNEAIRWGGRSYNSFYRPVTYNYLKTLKERKSLFEKSDEKKQ
jgi:tetratricopeptide (TPR) repeat protein